MENITDNENSAFQNSYARILDWGNGIGLVLLIVTFLLYVFGITQPLIPLEELPDYWGLNLSQYLEKTGAPTGWDWVFKLGKSEYQNYLGIVVLAGISFIAYGAMLAHSLKLKKNIIVVLIFIELILILIASSNILKISVH